MWVGQVQEGVLDVLRIVIVTRPADCASQVKERLSKVGAELIQQVRHDQQSTGVPVKVCSHAHC